jgi:hypothetical protein
MDRRECGSWKACGWLGIGVLIAFTTGCDDANSGAASQNCGAECTQGSFIDSPVEGIDYSGNAPLVFLDGIPAGARGFSGRTEAGGIFRWDPQVLDGSSPTAPPLLSFRVGQVELGSAPAGSVLTPVDLVPGATNETDPLVLGLTRFLLTADDDGILDEVRIAPEARTWAEANTINFSSPNQLGRSLTELASAMGKSPVLDGEAERHLKESLARILDGTYTGRWENLGGSEAAESPNCGQGSDSGVVTITVAATIGAGVDLDLVGTLVGLAVGAGNTTFAAQGQGFGTDGLLLSEKITITASPGGAVDLIEGIVTRQGELRAGWSGEAGAGCMLGSKQ